MDGITATDSMFSVREKPWHGKGKVLAQYPESISEALSESGLGWNVGRSPVYVDAPAVIAPERWGQPHPLAGQTGPVEVPGWVANVREDTGSVLGIVGQDYKIVQNEEAFKFMDALIGSDLHFETAGSINGGKRVWVLARLPEFIEVGGDTVGTYLYVANSHDGSLAVTSAVTPIRVVCQNTLGLALRQSGSQRTYKFRHTGDLQLRFEEARQVLGIAVNYEQRFKELGDRLAQVPFSGDQFDKIAREISGLNEDDLGKRALTIRRNQHETMLDLFHGRGEEGNTQGNSPNTAWTAVNAIGEYADYERRNTKRSNQILRSFEDTDLKQQGLNMVLEEAELEPVA